MRARFVFYFFFFGLEMVATEEGRKSMNNSNRRRRPAFFFFFFANVSRCHKAKCIPIAYAVEKKKCHSHILHTAEYRQREHRPYQSAVQYAFDRFIILLLS